MRDAILLIKLLHLAVQFRLISQHHSFQNAVFRLLKHCLVDLPDPLLKLQQLFFHRMHHSPHMIHLICVQCIGYPFSRII